MNFKSIRQLAVAAAWSVAVLAPSMAAASVSQQLATGLAISGPTVVSFKLLTDDSALFTLFVTEPGNVLVAPTNVTLSTTTGSILTLSAPYATGGAVSAFYDLTAGEYALSFDVAATGGMFTLNVSTDSGAITQLNGSGMVPEPGSVALVLAGLGVAGMLGRRRLGHGKGYAVPTYTA
jgi:PEP-CTERM motif